MRVLVTGCNGLIGSEAVLFYDARGDEVSGIDNNMRAEFFGAAGDTIWNLRRLRDRTTRFQHHAIDIRDRGHVFAHFAEFQPELVIHCAAQPSHDKAREIPLLDFEVNAMGTLNLLEATRLHAPGAVFIHMSTNKVYGDAPNEVPLAELETRWDYARPADRDGIAESCRIDQSTHSIMGASKLSADIMAQEYGRYFGLKVGIFRGGCLTGPSHSGVQLHGFLNYLVRVAVRGEEYTIFGYKGKQVRDNIHSADVIGAFEAYRSSPRPGEVYNLGGGRANSVSMLEAIARIGEIVGKPIRHTYFDRNRVGDHICYISDLTKFRRDYPGWRLERSLDSIIQEMAQTEIARAT